MGLARDCPFHQASIGTLGKFCLTFYLRPGHAPSSSTTNGREVDRVSANHAEMNLMKRWPRRAVGMSNPIAE